MQRPLLLSLSLLTAAGLTAQTAVDFTLNDCAGASHHLFDELDQGKIVILEFAMIPSCTPCIQAGGILQTVRNNFEATNPGRVKWYTWGGVDAYTCAQMSDWETSHSLVPDGTFIDGSAMATNYGGFSMPTIVALAGTDHNKIFEQHGFVTNLQGHITDAINAALTVSVNEVPMSTISASLAPNPANDVVNLNVSMRSTMDLSITVYDNAGRVVKSLPKQAMTTGAHTLPIAVDELAIGPYLLGISGSFGSQRIPFEVVR